MISSPANAITWNEFWEPFTDNDRTEIHVHGPRVRHGHNHRIRHYHCHRHYRYGYSHCHRHRHSRYDNHHPDGYGHTYDPHYYEGHNTEIIIR